MYPVRGGSPHLTDRTCAGLCPNSDIPRGAKKVVRRYERRRPTSAHLTADREPSEGDSRPARRCFRVVTQASSIFRFLTRALPAASRASTVSVTLTRRWRRSPRPMARSACRETRGVSFFRSPPAMKRAVTLFSA